MIDPLCVVLIPASLADYPVIQNLAQFYIYDASRDLGFYVSENGLYEPKDYKQYCIDSSKHAFLIKVGGEIAGFILLNHTGTDAFLHHSIGQFFIMAKYQGKGIGRQVANQIWDMHPGIWEIRVIPENSSAIAFWLKTIGLYTAGNFQQEPKTVVYDDHQPQRIFFTFDTKIKK